MKSDAVRVYTPDSVLRSPAQLVRDMARDLLASRELAWRLFVRDLSAQYRQSLFGYAWVFVPPLLAALPFIFLSAGGVMNVGDAPIPYPAFAVVGTVIWQSFVDALNAPLRAVSSARSMLTRVNFPREAILLAALAQVLFGFLIRSALVVAVFALFRIMPPPTAVLFPVGMFALILVGFVVGLVLTPIGLLYGDIGQALPVATTFLMFLTPVLYPTPHHGLAATVARLNPLTPLVTTTRDWLTTGVAPQAPQLFALGGAALVCLLGGWILYRIAMPHLISRLGN